MRYKNVEKVQLVLPPPRRPDTLTAKIATLPQPVARYTREFIFWLAEKAVSSDMLAAMLNSLIPHQSGTQDSYIAKFARWPQPLGIVSVGTYIKQNNPDVKVEILDGNNVLTLDQAIDKIDADVVGISATAGGYDNVIKVAKVAKQKGARIILGGAAATPLARDILRYYDFVDAVIRYDGEHAFSKYVAGRPLGSIENLVYRKNGEIREYDFSR